MDLDFDPERVNEPDENGRPPIVAAAYNDDHAFIEALIRAGADIEARSESGKSALYTAAVYGSPETVRLVISKGADLSEKDEILLAVVSARSPLESVRLMLEAGANPNYEKFPTPAVPGDCPWTPLQQAAAFGTLETVKLLVESGADVTSTPHALVSAVYRGRIETAEYLIDQGGDPNTRDAAGNPLLFVALEAPMAMLPDATTDIDPWDLQVALVQMLLGKGANPYIESKEGHTLLQAAMREDNKELIRVLERFGRQSPAE